MPTDIFMKIRDIQGESRDKDHKDEIEVLSWSWGLSNQVASPSPGGGAGAGKVKFQDISFTHLVDKASPNLMLSCASGKHHSGSQAHCPQIRPHDAPGVPPHQAAGCDGNRRSKFRHERAGRFDGAGNLELREGRLRVQSAEAGWNFGSRSAFQLGSQVEQAVRPYSGALRNKIKEARRHDRING